MTSHPSPSGRRSRQYAAARIRPASDADAGTLASLAGQLGYPADTVTITRRLHDIAAHGAGVVLVAELDRAGVVGMAHALPQRFAIDDPFVELAALVVDGAVRDEGVGLALLDAVERWAREHRFATLYVRSNVVRERAHRFYLRQGYAEVKRQAVFSKHL